MVKSLDMTHGNLFKQILIFSLPLIISNVLQILFNIADIAVVGKFCGSDALGSVGSTSILISLFTGFCIGVGSGVNAISAKYIGAKDNDRINKTISSSFILAILMGLFIAIVAIIFSKSILLLIKTNDELLDGALLYIRIYLCGMPGLTLFNYGNALFSANGNTKEPLLYLIISGILNVLLNLFFVLVCNLAVAGVAIASIIAQYLSALLILISLIKGNDKLKLSFKNFNFDKDIFFEVFRIAFPAGIQSSIFAIANLFIQSGVNSFDKVMIAGNTAAANADSLIYDIMAAIYVGCSSFISQNYGAKNKKRMLQSYLITLLYSFGISLFLGILLFIFGKPFLSIFTSDIDVIEAGNKRLVIMAFSYCVSAFMDNTLAASRGLGETMIPTIFLILGSCVFRIIWIYTIFAHFRTIQSLYLLYVFSWIITSIGEIIYFAYLYKKRIKTF